MNGVWRVLENIPNIDWKQICLKEVEYLLSKEVDIFCCNDVNKPYNFTSKVYLYENV
jgi:hypothetical protein